MGSVAVSFKFTSDTSYFFYYFFVFHLSISSQVSRLSALLDEQELHPIAAQSSNEAREEDNGQEEVIQGLKEELASAAAAQVRKIPYVRSALI